MVGVARAFDPWSARQQAFTSFAYSEADVRRILAKLASSATGSPLAAVGRTLVLAGPFTFKAAFHIPKECPGLTIVAASRFLIQPSIPALAAAFIVEAEFVTIRDIFLYGDASGYATTFVTTASTFAGGRSANNLRVLECDAFVDRVFVDASAGNCDDAEIDGVWQTAANGTHAAAVVVDSPGARVTRCVLKDGGGDSVTVGANGGNCSIIGNRTGGGDITTGASTGHNTISSNIMGGGTITVAGTDAVGLNT